MYWYIGDHVIKLLLKISFLIIGAGAVAHFDRYGQGSGAIHILHVSCAGSESRVTDCSHSTSSWSDHSFDVGVQCQPAGNNTHLEHYILIVYMLQ